MIYNDDSTIYTDFNLPEHPTLEELTQIMDQANHNLKVLDGLIKTTIHIMKDICSMIETQHDEDIKEITEE